MSKSFDFLFLQPVYETDDTQVSPEKVKRVVIVIPAKGEASRAVG